jgi:hypothetical protein
MVQIDPNVLLSLEALTASGIVLTTEQRVSDWISALP